MPEEEKLARRPLMRRVYRRVGGGVLFWAKTEAAKHAKRRENCKGELLADTPHADTPIRLLWPCGPLSFRPALAK